jgi:hypothetical protein
MKSDFVMSHTIIDDIDFGPLALLPGCWKGDKGVDIAPSSDGTVDESLFHEELMFETVGHVSNAGQQLLAAVRYHQKVYQKSDNTQFHDQVGYWIWDDSQQTVMFTLTIPRGVALVAGGQFDPESATGGSVFISVESNEGGDWGVAQSPFMRDNATTKGFKIDMQIDGNKLSYSQTTFLDIYGRSFDHTDKSQLTKV